MTARPSDRAVAMAFCELFPDMHGDEAGGWKFAVIERARELDASGGKAVGEMDRTAPPRVYLQIDPDGDNADRSEPIPESAWMDLTWHYERIGGQEVEYIRADLASPADDAGVRVLAPWPDFAGNVIRHGDRLRHPDGTTFTAIRLAGGHEYEVDAWRCIYDHIPEGYPSRLSLQIGDEGQAVVLAASPADDAGVRVPREPTEAMVAAAAPMWLIPGSSRGQDIRAVYRAMLAAASTQEGG